MNPQVSQRDYEKISEYLDGGLAPKERASLESRLKKDPGFKDAFEKLQHTRSLFKRLPGVRAPRNFTLTPTMVGASPARLSNVPRSYQTFRLSAILSSVLLAFVLLGDLLSSSLRPSYMAMAPAPAQVEQMALPAAATNGVEVMREESQPEEGNIISATSMPMLTSAAGMVAANEQGTTPVSTQAATEVAKPAAAVGDAAQPKEVAPTATFIPLSTPTLLAAAPPEPESIDALSESAVEAPPSANTPFLSQPEAEQATPTRVIQEGAPSAQSDKMPAAIPLWRVVEVFLILVLLISCVSAWWVRS